jgi:2'-5' RNA ligase
VPPALSAPSDALRLFVALWPDASAHTWLREADSAVAWPRGAARAGPERWHITLHFLGAVPQPALPTLLPALQTPFDPFGFELGRVEAWPRGLVVVEPAQSAPALQDLQTALGQAVQRCGLPVESRAFKPHVTLARRAAGARLATPSPPQRWPVAAYALVASAGGRYRNVALYPGGVLSAAADPAPATTQTRPAPRPTRR